MIHSCYLSKKERRERADKILTSIHSYLDDCGWGVCLHTLFRVDPVTGTKYPGDTAFMVQVSRDLSESNR